MVKFTATILQFASQGEKTGWMYIPIAEKYALALKPGNKKSFRVKGRIDAFPLKAVALLPMGGGEFILPFNASLRKGTGKTKGAKVNVVLEADDKPVKLNAAFLACLADEPTALSFFNSLPGSHRLYFNKWIEAAKTEATRVNRIATAVSALARKMNYAGMLHARKDEREILKSGRLSSPDRL